MGVCGACGGLAPCSFSHARHQHVCSRLQDFMIASLQAKTIACSVDNLLEARFCRCREPSACCQAKAVILTCELHRVNPSSFASQSCSKSCAVHGTAESSLLKGDRRRLECMLRLFMVRATQLLPHTRHSDTEARGTPSLAAGQEAALR